MCGGKNASTTSTTTPNAQAAGAYSSLLAQAGNAAATPYTAYSGEGVAPVNAQQAAGIQGINSYANAAQAPLAQAMQYTQQAAQPITQAQIQSYYSPYNQDVINKTVAQFANQNAQQMEGVQGNAIAQGALGGNREAIAQAETANQQQLAQAPVIAGLENTGYNQAVQLALQQQQNLGQQAYGLTSEGQAAQNAGLSGAGAQVGAGTLQQQTQNATDQYNYQQYLNALAYPYQTDQWLAGIDTSVGSQMGGTSTTTPPAPNPLSTALGVGTSAAGILGSLGTAGGSAGLAGLAAFLADGGAVAGHAHGGGVDHQTLPESRETLLAQQKQLLAGHRRVQMFPKGTPELPTPKGTRRLATNGHVFHYNPDKIDADEIKYLTERGRENEFLDLGPYNKHDIIERARGGETPVAIVERDPHGTEVRAAMGTHMTAHHQLAAIHRTKSPGHSVGLEPPGHTLMRRTQRAFGGGVQGLDIGGVPYGGGSGYIGGGGSGYVPSTNMAAHGNNMPKAPGAEQNPLDQQLQQIGAAAKSLNNAAKPNNQNMPMNILPSSESFSPTPVGSTQAYGLDPSSFSPDPSGGQIYKRGGRVADGLAHGYADGGGPSTDFDPTTSLGDGIGGNSAAIAYGMPVQGDFASNPDVTTPDVPLPRPRPDTPAPAGISVSADDDGSAGATGPTITGFKGLYDAFHNGVAAPSTPQESKSEGISPNFWHSLIAAGAGMMGRSPYFGVNLGQGLSQGLSSYEAGEKLQKEQALSQKKVDLETQKLSEELNLHRRTLDNQTKEIGLRQQQVNINQMLPHLLGQDAFYRNVYGHYGPDGKAYGVDGKPVDLSKLTMPGQTPPGILAPPAAPGAKPSRPAQTSSNDLPGSDTDDPLLRAAGGAAVTGDADVPDGTQPDANIQIPTDATPPVPVQPDAAIAPSVPPVRVAQAAGDDAGSDWADQPTPNGVPRIDVGGNYGAIPGVNYGLKGEDFLNQFSPDIRAEVKNYMAGRSAPTANPRSSKGQFSDPALVKRIASIYGESIGDVVDESTYARRRNYRTQLGSASAASAGGQKNLLTTSLGHLADLALASENMQNANGPDIPFGTQIGSAYNYLGNTRPKNSENVKALETTAHRYSGEVGKLYGGPSGGTGAERLQTAGNYDASNNPFQFAGSLKADRDLIFSKIKAMEQQRNDILGKQGGDVHFLNGIDRQNLNIITGAIHRLEGQTADARAAELKSQGVADNIIQQQLKAERWPGTGAKREVPGERGGDNSLTQATAQARALIANDSNMSPAKKQAIIDRYVKMGGNPADLQ